MILPVEKNIRFKGIPRQQRWKFGVPVVYSGDWLAQRPVAGHPARLVYDRQPWEGSSYVRTPAEPLPVAMSGFMDDVRAAAAAEVMRPLLPWLIGGGVLLFAGGVMVGTMVGGE